MASNELTFADDIPTKDKIVVREYLASDFKDILNARYPFSTAEFAGTFNYWKSRILDTLGKLETRRLVAYCPHEKKTVGIVTLKKINKNIWSVSGTFVSPSYRRRGISLLLHQASFSYLRRKGVKKAVAAVNVNNIASIKSMEKMYDQPLSQKYYEFHGNISNVPKENQTGILIRDFRSSDRNAMFQIYTECIHQDWYSFLEIDKSNFLDRFIPGHSFPSGLFKLLSKKSILIAEGHNSAINDFAVVPSQKIPTRRKIATLYFFISPQLLLQEVVVLFKKLLNAPLLRGFRDLSMFSLNTNEKLLCDFSDILSTDFGFRTSQNLVYTKTLT